MIGHVSKRDCDKFDSRKMMLGGLAKARQLRAKRRRLSTWQTVFRGLYVFPFGLWSALLLVRPAEYGSLLTQARGRVVLAMAAALLIVFTLSEKGVRRMLKREIRAGDRVATAWTFAVALRALAIIIFYVPAMILVGLGPVAATFVNSIAK